jgi:hypothetical protein
MIERSGPTELAEFRASRGYGTLKCISKKIRVQREDVMNVAG